MFINIDDDLNLEYSFTCQGSALSIDKPLTDPTKRERYAKLK